MKFKTGDTCKLNIVNAEFKHFYLKNWILTHGCTAIFDKHQREEIAVLHIDKCWTHVCPCRELPGWHTGDSLHDANGIFHADRDKLIEDGMVNWSSLCEEIQN